jgi:predicted HTH transcriptional regulator
MQNIKDLLASKEGFRVEAKKSAEGLPNSLWESYSAFANSDGGTILLGVSEVHKKLTVTGVKDAAQKVQQLWDLLNNRQKVSDNILSERHIYVQTIEEKEIIVMEVPRADRHYKPVYINGNPMDGTYRRNGEGDYRCSSMEVRAMLRDQSDVAIDSAVIDELNWRDLDKDCISRYRNRFSSLKPAHVWNELPLDEFLQKLGAVKRVEKDLKPTLAGLVMFGTEDVITQILPDYFLDYREIYDKRRWSDRVVSNLGEWSGNIYDFFFKMLGKLTADVKTPFQLRKGIDRIDETGVHTSLREALANTLIHADYYGRRGIVIEKEKHKIVLANPGILRPGIEDALAGGISDPRNPTIFKMFAMIDIGERAGSGLYGIQAVWKESGWAEPVLKETFNPERTVLTVEVEFDSTTPESGDTTPKTEDTTLNNDGTTPKTGNTTLKVDSTTQGKIIQTIKNNPQVTRQELADMLQLTLNGVKYHLRQLTGKGIVKHIGSARSGEWIVL